MCTSATLECMPESCYRAKPYYNVQEDPKANNESHILSTSVADIDSDVTEQYWPLGNSGDDEVTSDHDE